MLYDYEGTDAEYGIHVESGMYGGGSKLAYDEDHEIHLDGTKQDSTSKLFYGVPDTPPEKDEGIEWLDPLNFSVDSLFSAGSFAERFPLGPGYIAHLIKDDDDSEFAEHVAHYAANLMGVDHDYYYTPYEELENKDFDFD